MQEPSDMTRLPVDIIKNIHHHLVSVQDKSRFIGSCSSFFNLREQVKKDLREAYILTFITKNPLLIQQYSEEKAFNWLLQNFIIPFNPSNPKPIDKTSDLVKKAMTQCLTLGFETLYLQLLRSDAAFRLKNVCNSHDVEINFTLSLQQTLDFQLEVIKLCKYPVNLFIAIAKTIEPYAYFTALGATLINRRIDLFDELLNHFEENKLHLTDKRCVVKKGNRLVIAHLTNNVARKWGLTLDNVKDWSPQFCAEIDGIGFSDYLNNTPYKTVFTLCLAKRAEPNSNHALHFLWACYAGDSSCILNYDTSPTLLIEAMQTIQESPLSLYAHNVNLEETCVIKKLLEAYPEIMHSRNAMQQTPLQIAIHNNKFELVLAILEKTDDATWKETYSRTEKAAINKAMIEHLEGLTPIQHVEDPTCCIC